MLKNKTKLSVKVKYNGRTRELKPGEGIDLRDFDVANKDINGAEKHVMSKYPDTFSKEKSIGDPERDKQIQTEINDLQTRNDLLVKDIAAVRAVNNELSEKYQAACGEVQAEKERANSLKAETDAATEKVNGLEDEVEKLRLQIAQGPKKKK